MEGFWDGLWVYVKWETFKSRYLTNVETEGMKIVSLLSCKKQKVLCKYAKISNHFH